MAASNRVELAIPWRTLLKVVLAAALVWRLLRLLPIILVLFVAVVLAVTLDPVVKWLELRGVKRGAGAILVGLALVALLGGFLWLSWASLGEQAVYVSKHVREVGQHLLAMLPEWARGALTSQGGAAGSRLGDLAMRVGQSAMWAADGRE